MPRDGLIWQWRAWENHKLLPLKTNFQIEDFSIKFCSSYEKEDVKVGENFNEN